MFTKSRPKAYSPIKQTGPITFETEIAKCVLEADLAKAEIDKQGALEGLVVWRDDWLMEEAILRTDGHA